jgi:23S rRNA pseudouridine2605 synthase
MDKTVRLDKYLANLGTCSRRNIKALLKEHVLTVNGERVRESGYRLDPQNDELLLDGQKIAKPKLVYFLLNKPKGIVSTTADELGRKNVTSLIPTKERVYPVGRLDKDTTGLIILTNDGELTNLLTHPRFHVPKIYRLTIKGRPTQEQVQSFQKGVLLPDGITSPAHVTVVKQNDKQSTLDVTLHEGWNRQIRRMCETVGIQLLELERIQFGPLKLAKTPRGSYRQLTKLEVEALSQAVRKETNQK